MYILLPLVSLSLDSALIVVSRVSIFTSFIVTLQQIRFSCIYYAGAEILGRGGEILVCIPVRNMSGFSSGTYTARSMMHFETCGTGKPFASFLSSCPARLGIAKVLSIKKPFFWPIVFYQAKHFAKIGAFYMPQTNLLRTAMTEKV